MHIVETIFFEKKIYKIEQEKWAWKFFVFLRKQ